MKTLKTIAVQLKRIADSMMMIEITLLKINKTEYLDLQKYAKDYNEVSDSIGKQLENTVEIND